MTDRTHPTDKESPMTPKTRHDELVALLSKISEESVTTSDVLADVLDLLRERLPEPEGVKDKTSPADDLPGEPVEPGDLRAGDRVAFAWGGTGERIIGALVSDQGVDALRSDAPDSGGYSPNVVHKGREWCAGISDVRLIERAPREDEDRDEALAMDLYHASLKIPPVSEIGPTAWDDFTRRKWIDVARAARERIEAEGVKDEPDVEPRIAAAVEHLRDYSCCDVVARILGSET